MSSAENVKAVEMVREIRERHHELLKGKSPEVQNRFYREQAALLHKKLGIREKTKRES